MIKNILYLKIDVDKFTFSRIQHAKKRVNRTSSIRMNATHEKIVEA